MSAAYQSETLPCGRDKERLLALVADRSAIGDNTHEASCPYCQAALGELRLLWAPVTRWAAQDVTVPADLVRVVIARVRRLVQSPRHVVTSAARGATTVTSWVVSLIAGETAQRVDGVDRVTAAGLRRRGGGRTATVRGAADGVEVSEIGADAVGVQFGITAMPVGDLLGLADEVRQAVISQLRSQAGIEAAEVDISVDRLLTDD